MTLKVNHGHKRPSLYQKHSSTFVYWPIFKRICMNANIMKTQLLQDTTLTYDLMDNFCPCLYVDTLYIISMSYRLRCNAPIYNACFKLFRLIWIVVWCLLPLHPSPRGVQPIMGVLPPRYLLFQEEGHQLAPTILCK